LLYGAELCEAETRAGSRPQPPQRPTLANAAYDDGQQHAHLHWPPLLHFYLLRIVVFTNIAHSLLCQLSFLLLLRLPLCTSVNFGREYAREAAYTKDHVLFAELDTSAFLPVSYRPGYVSRSIVLTHDADCGPMHPPYISCSSSPRHTSSIDHAFTARSSYSYSLSHCSTSTRRGLTLRLRLTRPIWR
jgi:hypothetical protein